MQQSDHSKKGSSIVQFYGIFYFICKKKPYVFSFWQTTLFVLFEGLQTHNTTMSHSRYYYKLN